ncbi:MAG TPA: glycosyltransferase family 4 protein [Acidimicrobiales bacterium]|nr:glycosyltransferase family 4 protein [Acidimicrobiales bacterium]
MRTAASATRSYRASRRLRLPRLRLGVSEGRLPTIFYVCPDVLGPTGGASVIYQHVEALNANGARAVVMHAGRGHRYPFGPPGVPVVCAADARITPEDLLVVPEMYSPSFGTIPSSLRVLVFNQNVHLPFHGHGSETQQAFLPYRRPNVLGVLCVSQDNEDYLRYAMEGLAVERVRNRVDETLFHPAGDWATTPCLAYMPRRRAEDRRELFALLEARSSLDGWEVKAIDGCTPSETADILRTSAVFLSFSEREGFGLPPAEAMACGCYVVGFTGLAGREYFRPDFCTPVPEGDVLAFARATEEVLGRVRQDRPSVHAAGRRASEFILAEYSAEHQVSDLRRVYERFL